MAKIMKLKSIGVLSLAKLEGIIMALVGLVLGLFMAAFGVVAGSIGRSPFAGLGIAAVIILPIIYGVCGFVGGAIGALVYNLIAGWIGGIELELQ